MASCSVEFSISALELLLIWMSHLIYRTRYGWNSFQEYITRSLVIYCSCICICIYIYNWYVTVNHNVWTIHTYKDRKRVRKRVNIYTLSTLLVLCEMNPPFIDGFPSQQASNTELWRLPCFYPKQAVEQRTKSLVIWVETSWRSYEFTVMEWDLHRLSLEWISLYHGW